MKRNYFFITYFNYLLLLAGKGKYINAVLCQVKLVSLVYFHCFPFFVVSKRKSVNSLYWLNVRNEYTVHGLCLVLHLLDQAIEITAANHRIVNSCDRNCYISSIVELDLLILIKWI